MAETDELELDFGAFEGNGGRGSDDGRGPQRPEDEGGGLIGFLVDLDNALDNVADDFRFRLAIESDNEFPSLARLSNLGAELARRDGRQRVKFLIRDLTENYPLRQPQLAAMGLTGDPVVYKTRLAQRRRASVRQQLEDLGERFRGWQRYFNLAAAIISSLLEAMQEIPGMKALIEALKELLEFLAFNAEEIADQH
jgi:hypothetical protein